MEPILSGVTVKIEEARFRRELALEPGTAHIVAFNLSRRSANIRASYVSRLSRSGYHRIGPVSFLPAGIGLHAVGEDSGAQMLMCRFQANPAMDLFGSPDDLDPDSLAPCIDIRDYDILRALERLVAEMRCPGMASQELVAGIAKTLAIDLARLAHRDTDASARERQLARIESCLDALPMGRVELAGVARACGLSPRRVGQIVKAATGQSFAQFLAGYRVRLARRLLETTALPIKEVAHRCGFRHTSSFTAAFRDTVGMTPGQYRAVTPAMRG